MRQPPLDRSLDAAAVAWMVLLTFLWGANAVTVKVVTGGITPVMGAALRSGIALVLLSAYGWWRGEPLWPRGRLALHGVAIGLMFTAEFILVYSGARLSNGGHTSIFLNTSPVFVAVGAHFLLPGDRLTRWRALGLAAAFAGIVVLFSDKPQMWDTGYWRGDLLVLAGAALWGAQTLYIKRWLVGRMSAFAMLHIQILVSVLVMALASAAFEHERFFAVDAAVAGSVLFQGVVVVFFSYLVFMALLTRYPASGVQSFTFLSPIWGVVLGALLLHEPVSAGLAGGLTLVGLGLFWINRPTPAAPPRPTSGVPPAPANTSRTPPD